MWLRFMLPSPVFSKSEKQKKIALGVRLWCGRCGLCEEEEAERLLLTGNRRRNGQVRGCAQCEVLPRVHVPAGRERRAYTARLRRRKGEENANNQLLLVSTHYLPLPR